MAVSNPKTKRISKILIIAGIVLLVCSIICFAGLGITCLLVNQESPYLHITVKELIETVKQAKVAQKAYGISFSEIGESMGIPGFLFTLLFLFVDLRIPTLILGILVLAAGIIIRLVSGKAPSASGVPTVNGRTTYTPPMLSTVRCEKCGKTLPAGTKFCSGCGNILSGSSVVQPLTKSCPKCGHMNSESTKFCTRCGNSLEAPAPAPDTSTTSIFADSDQEICSVCGNVLKPNARFCPGCGAEVKKLPEPPTVHSCKNCGAVLKENAKFCMTCGAKTENSDDVTVPEPVSHAPAKEKTAFFNPGDLD